MYVPGHFGGASTSTLQDLMERFSFATLVSPSDGSLQASHLPFKLDRTASEFGSLSAHMARANPQWRAFDGTTEVLVIFQGEHGYISPAWYAEHPSVPTWNYTAVHAYGLPRIIDDAHQVRAVLEQLVSTYERDRPDPWRMDLPEDYLTGMMRGIVAFEIPITRLEGKLKMSQNRPEVDQRQVIESLEASGDPSQQALARAMRRALGA